MEAAPLLIFWLEEDAKAGASSQRDQMICARCGCFAMSKRSTSFKSFCRQSEEARLFET